MNDTDFVASEFLRRRSRIDTTNMTDGEFSRAELTVLRGMLAERGLVELTDDERRQYTAWAWGVTDGRDR